MSSKIVELPRITPEQGFCEILDCMLGGKKPHDVEIIKFSNKDLLKGEHEEQS